MGKEVILRILFCLESFQMMSNGERKFLLFFSLQLIIAGFILFIWKIRALPKMCCFTLERSNGLSQNWEHVRTRQTSENQTTDRKCVLQTNSRLKWSWFYSGMSEFNYLAVVLFSAMFSCFLLDSFELHEMVCLTKHGATFSSLNISRRYDEHACDTIFFSLCWKLKN